MRINTKPSQPAKNIRLWLFLTFCLIIITVNGVKLIKELKNIQRYKKVATYQFDGMKFMGLNKTLENTTYIGYFTDKNMSDDNNARQFAQAQLILAPVILDLNNTSHQWILFDCTIEAVALKKIKEIGAAPVKRNQFGIILAKRK